MVPNPLFCLCVEIKGEHKTDVFSGALLPGACYLFTAWKMEVKIQFLGIRAPCGELISLRLLMQFLLSWLIFLHHF